VNLLEKAKILMEKEMDISLILIGLKEIQKFKDLFMDEA